MSECTFIRVPEYQFPPFELTGFLGPDEWDEFLRELRKVKSAYGENQNDCAAVSIAMCIDNKIDTMRLIRDVLALVGYNPRHVAIMVKLYTGLNPARHLWIVDSAGKYHSLPNTILAAA